VFDTVVGRPQVERWSKLAHDTSSGMKDEHHVLGRFSSSIFAMNLQPGDAIQTVWKQAAADIYDTVCIAIRRESALGYVWR